MKTETYILAAAAILAGSLFFLVSNFLLLPVLRLVKAFTTVEGREPEPFEVQRISVIVPAYNEERYIREKIETIHAALQCADVDAEVLIGSDGSTDRTVEIARACLEEVGDPRWKILEFENSGKCSTINRLVEAASADIVVSTDADIPVPGDAFSLICTAFRSDAGLGCVSCVPVLNSRRAGSQNRYWRLEDRIRSAESTLGRLIVVTGWLCAFRKDAFEEIPRGVMADDLWIPLTVLLNGYGCRQLENLRAASEPTDEDTEIRRRKRVISGGMDVVRRLLPRLTAAPAILFLVVMHKITRWALPLWLAFILLSSIVIQPALLIAYGLLAASALFVLGKKRFLSLTYAVASPLLSFVEVVRKSDFACWEHTRNDEGAAE